MTQRAARRRAIVPGLLLALAGAAAALWWALDPGPLHSIGVTSFQESADRPFWQITLHEDGRYAYGTLSGDREGKLGFAPWAARLRAIPELRWLPAPDRPAQPGMAFWAVGTRRTVAPFAYGAGADHAQLRAFGNALHDAVLADVRRQDAPRIAALNALAALRSVELRAGGAMCRRCLWTMRIDAGGTARLENGEMLVPGRPHQPDRVAHLRWREIVRALRRAQLGDLDARYPSNVMDGAGVSFAFAFPHATYRIDAPNYGSWPRALRVAYVELLGEFERARWSPPLDPQSFPDSASFRAWAERAH